MPEMTPDPVYDKLAKFSPDAAVVDPSVLLFEAGRATARTPWAWKAAVAALLVANVVSVGFIMFRKSEPLAPLPQPEPAPTVVPESSPPVSAPASEDPWSYRSLMSVDDPDQLPRVVPAGGMVGPNRPLTVLSARRGELD